MEGQNETLRLVQSIYDVVLGREDWPSVIGKISAASKGHSGLLRLIDCRHATEGFVAAYGYDASALQAYREHFVHLDPYRNHLATASTGALLASDEFVPLAGRQHTEYHNDYERPQDRIHALGSPLGRERDFLLYLGLSRGRRAGPYDAATLSFLRDLLPHLSRAVLIQRLVGSAVKARQLGEAALDQVRIGIVLLDAAGAVRFANRAALEAANSFGIRIGGSGLQLPHSRVNHHLQRLIAHAGMAPATTPPAGGDLSLAAPGVGILQIRVLPFRSSAEPALGTQQVQTAIFLVHPGQSRLSAQQLAVQFGLTAAESRLAARLAHGETLAEAASAASTSIATARTHLRGIFRKTATRRQAELVQLLLTSLANLATDGNADRSLE